MPRLPWLAGLVAALVVGACGPSASPGPPEGWIRLEDAPERLSIDVPGHWRSLEPGDPGWRIVYGDRVSSSEEAVTRGSMAIFAVPLEPRDDDVLVLLAIYRQQLTEPATPSELADAYIDEAQRIGDYQFVGRAACELPAGSCEWIVLDRNDAGIPVRLFFWYFVAGERAFLVNFNSQLGNVDHYLPVFEQSVATFRILPPAVQ